jgi:hypothetical protein
MTLPWLVSITPPSGTTWTATVPMAPWDRRGATEGGFRKVTSGAREGRVDRRDRKLVLRVRVWESEAVAFEAAIASAQDAPGTAFTVDLGNGTPYSVYLEAPTPEDELNPSRGETLGLLEYTLTVSKVDGSAWVEVYV